MPFTPLPPRFKAPSKTRHTELAAVLGEAGRDHELLVALAPEAARFQVLVPGTPPQEQPVSSWTWGAAAPEELPLQGALLTAGPEGLLLTDGGEEDGDRVRLDVWRGPQKVRTLTGASFAVWAPEGRLVHGRLCLTSRIEGLAVIDLDTGQRLHTLAPRGPPGPQTPPPLPFSPLPDGGIAVGNGASLVLHDLASGEKRREFPLPPDQVVHALAISPDGKTALLAMGDPRALVHNRFVAMDLETGGVTELLSAQKPLRCRVAWAAQGRLAVTSTSEGHVQLWEPTTWQPLETLRLEPENHSKSMDLYPWDAHQALVVKGMRGLLYVFTVSAEPLADAPPARGGKAARGAAKGAKAAR